MSTKAQNETAGEEIQLDELAGVAGGLAGRPALNGLKMTVQPGATLPSQVKGGGLMGAAMRAGSAAHLRGKALGAFEKAFVQGGMVGMKVGAAKQKVKDAALLLRGRGGKAAAAHRPHHGHHRGGKLTAAAVKAGHAAHLHGKALKTFTKAFVAGGRAGLKVGAKIQQRKDVARILGKGRVGAKVVARQHHRTAAGRTVSTRAAHHGRPIHGRPHVATRATAAARITPRTGAAAAAVKLAPRVGVVTAAAASTTRVAGTVPVIPRIAKTGPVIIK